MSNQTNEEKLKILTDLLAEHGVVVCELCEGEGNINTSSGKSICPNCNGKGTTSK